MIPAIPTAMEYLTAKDIIDISDKKTARYKAGRFFIPDYFSENGSKKRARTRALFLSNFLFVAIAFSSFLPFMSFDLLTFPFLT